MTPEQQNSYLSKLRDWADAATELAARAAALADEHAKFGAPQTFPDREGNLIPIADADYVALISTLSNYDQFWDAGNGTNIVKVSR